MEKNIIKQQLGKHYQPSSVRAIMNGRRKPSLDVIVELQKIGIPLDAWLDFPSWLNSQTIPAQEAHKQDQTKTNLDQGAAA